MNKCEIIAISNQKGGVGKTTTTLNLGVALAHNGKKVLLIDADSQGDLTTSLGYKDQNNIKYTLSSLIDSNIRDIKINIDDYILHHKEGVDLIPSNIDLSSTEVNLVNAMSREYALKNCIVDLKDKYDYILVDCMPSLGMITINALACADKVIIPVQAQYLAVNDMNNLLETIGKVKRQINPNLEVGGILLTLVDNRTNLARETSVQLHKNYGGVIKIYNTTIPMCVKVAESTIFGESIFSYSKNTKIAMSYDMFAKEVVKDDKKRVRHATQKNYSR